MITIKHVSILCMCVCVYTIPLHLIEVARCRSLNSHRLQIRRGHAPKNISLGDISALRINNLTLSLCPNSRFADTRTPLYYLTRDFFYSAFFFVLQDDVSRRVIGYMKPNIVRIAFVQQFVIALCVLPTVDCVGFSALVHLVFCERHFFRLVRARVCCNRPIGYVHFFVQSRTE